jgi:hypothetical protein
MTARRRAARVPARGGSVTELTAREARVHGVPMGHHYVEYRERGTVVDSATYPTRAECEHWLAVLYKIEATDGTV